MNYAPKPTATTATKTGKARWSSLNPIKDCYRMAEKAGLLTAPEATLLEILVERARVFEDGQILNTNPVAALAILMKRDRSTIYRIFESLYEKGWLIDRTSSNGFRGFYYGHWFGVDLTPAQERSQTCRESLQSLNQEAIDNNNSRTQLKAAKGSLKSTLNRIGAQLGAVADRAADVLDQIPRRYDGVPTSELQRLRNLALATVAELLKAAGRLGRAKTGHPCSTNDAPNTDTNKEDSISNTATAQTHEADVVPEPPQPRSSVNHEGLEKKQHPKPELPDAITLLSEAENEALEELFRESSPQTQGQSQNILNEGVGHIARARWHNLGGDIFDLKFLFGSLSEIEASVMLFLLSDRATNSYLPPLRNMHRYARKCVKAAVEGTFDWSAGVKSAARRVGEQAA